MTNSEKLTENTDLNARLIELMDEAEAIPAGAVADGEAGEAAGASVNASVDVPTGASASVPAGADADRPGGTLASLLGNPQIMAKLPDIMATLAPMLNRGSSGADTKKGGDVRKDGKSKPDCMTPLLIALKPYMSPRRCEAIDFIVRLDKIGVLLHGLI